MIEIDKKTVAAVRDSGLFDERFYLERYPDVATLGMDPIEHYVWIGTKLGRNPSAGFSTTDYLEQNADVARSGVNPLYHYARWGREEGRTAKFEGSRRRRILNEPGTTYIDSGPFRVRRHYERFDSGAEDRFLGGINTLYLGQQDAIDSVCATIVMPTYNREDQIEAAIRSVLDQTHPNWRLIIVDDGSDDNTSGVVADFLKDDRVEYLAVDHIGVSGARNAAVERSSGKYIAYLDSDNTWKPNFLRSMITFMETHNLQAAYSGIRSSDDNDKTLNYRGDVFVWSACLKANYIDLNPFVHRRDLLVREGEATLFDTELKRFVDWDLILRLTADADVSYAPFIGVEYYDGDSGARITRTEYQSEEADRRIEAIRAKHSHRKIGSECLDTGAGVALAAAPTFEGNLGTKCYELRFFPDYTIANAYQTLLYARMDVADARAGSIDDCLQLIFRPAFEDTVPVFHLHWTSPIFAPARDDEHADRLIDMFLVKLRLFKALGGRIIWTVHNVMSHEPKYARQELRFHKALCDIVHWIHVHHESVMERTKPEYELPRAKVLVAEHGNYIGTLPDEITGAQARAQLGIPDNAKTFLFLGQIRGYKGIDELIAAFRELRVIRSDCWLVMAGKVLGVSEEDIAERLAECGQVVFRPGYVPDDEMQVYLKSAEAMVLPYRKVLTSGSVFLALSFGLPVICPRLGLLSHIVEDRRNGFLYDPEADKGLFRAMQDFANLPAEDAELLCSQAISTARSYRWEDTANKLLVHIAGMDFGTHVVTEINGGHRAWFVRGDREALRGKTAIAIVLHYRHLDDTRECIDRISQQGDDIGVVVISNHESPHDINLLAGEYTNTVLVQAEENTGYAAANNFGLLLCREVGAEFFWIINPDILVPEGYFDDLVMRVKDWPDHDFFGTTIVPAHEPSKVLFCGGAVHRERGASPGHMYMGQQTDQLPVEPFPCDYLTGANIFGRTSALTDAGFLPEDYFLYFEETHWFLGMVESGNLKKPLVLPDLKIQNLKRSENGLVPSLYYIYYFIRNSLIFGKRFAPGEERDSEHEARKFADAWLDKIARAAPDRLPEFRLLVERAIADGRAGKTGRVVL